MYIADTAKLERRARLSSHRSMHDRHWRTQPQLLKSPRSQPAQPAPGRTMILARYGTSGALLAHTGSTSSYPPSRKAAQATNNSTLWSTINIAMGVILMDQHTICATHAQANRWAGSCTTQPAALLVDSPSIHIECLST